MLQRVEILKALYRDARVLILDEPTAVLTPQERDSLFDVLRRLREDGRTILFITHKLNEVMALSDRVTVLRRGRVVAEMETVDDVAGRAVAGDDRTPRRPRSPPPRARARRDGARDRGGSTSTTTRGNRRVKAVDLDGSCR